MTESDSNAENRPGMSGKDFKRRGDYYSPKNLSKALQIRKELGYHAVVIAGGTDVMVDHFEELHRVEHWLDLNNIDELRQIEFTDKEIRIGSMVTHQELAQNEKIRRNLPLLSESAAEVGSWQIRCRGTIGGNIVTASPAGDTLAPLLAHQARFVVGSVEGKREIPAEEFFLGPKQNALEPSELLLEIILPRPSEDEFHYWEKVGKRQAMIISSLTIAMNLKYAEDGRIKEARPCYGAVAPTPIMLDDVADYLRGNKIARINIARVGELAAESVAPIDDIRGTETYRRQVTRDITIKALKAFREKQEDDS